MSDPEAIKRLSVSHAHLRSAAKFVSGGIPEDLPAANVPLADVESTLSESSLGGWVAALARAGNTEEPRAGFWRDLERAAEAIGLAEESATYRLRFLATVSKK